MHPTTLCSFIVALFLVDVPTSLGLDNGVARTPPMGWMSWQRFRCQTDCKRYPRDCIDQNLILRTSKKMKEAGWLAAGYEYVIIDDCWMDRKRDNVTQELRADPVRFPMGYPKIGEYIHSLGLKVGIYLDYGTNTCAGYPGVIDHMKTDADTMGKWKADYIKLDGCYSDHKDKPKGYAEFGKFLNATGRPMVYSCSYPAYAPWQKNTSVLDWQKLANDCNLWRMLGDIDDSWGAVSYMINSYAKFDQLLRGVAGPGHWNDPDMLIVGNYGLSKDQARVQMGMWCMLAAPLLLSVDLDTIDAESTALLQNRHLIAIDQDSAGIEASMIKTKGSLQYWMRPLGFTGTEYAIAILYRSGGGSPINVDLSLADFNIKPLAAGEKFMLHDVFDGMHVGPFGIGEKFEWRINPVGIAMFRVTKV